MPGNLLSKFRKGGICIWDRDNSLEGGHGGAAGFVHFKSARDAMAGSELFGRIVIFPIHRKTLVALAISKR